MKSVVMLALGILVLLSTLGGTLLLTSSTSAADIYVNNVVGSNDYDGSSPVPEGSTRGPVASLQKAVDLLKTSDHISIANTGKPYRSGMTLLWKKNGVPGNPIVIDGNGAILEGLETVQPSEWRAEPDGLYSYPWGHWRGFAVWIDGRVPKHMFEVDAKPSFNDIKPGESVWFRQEKRGYFRLPEGKKLSDLHLELPEGFFGICLHECSYVTIRNVHARYFADDGFNEAGECNGLVFENIEASYNGDQGMSAHNSVSACVYNAYFHDNHDGIVDTEYSQTTYHGLRCENNWFYGAALMGGSHVITNAVLRDNAQGVVLQQLGDLTGYDYAHDPLTYARARLYNVYVSGGTSGLDLQGGSTASVEHCTFVGNDKGVIIEDKACQLHLVSSIVASSKITEMDIVGTGYFGGYNMWSTGAIRVDGKPDTLQNWSAGKGIEEHSLFGDPGLVGGIGPELTASSPALGKAYWSKEMAAYFKDDVSPPFDDTKPYSNADIGARFTDSAR